MGKHIVICGGGAALAQPLVRRLLEQENRVTAICRGKGPDLGALADVCSNKMKGTLEWIKGINLSWVGMDCDETRAVEKVKAIDALVVMPGATANAKLTEMSWEQWDEVVGSCLNAVFASLRHFLPEVVSGGNVVVVGSVVGSSGGYGCANYAAAKAGLVGLVRAAANEFASRDIKINLLELGYIDEGMGKRLPETVKTRTLASIPLGRFGKSEDFVKAVEFLMDTDYMTGGILTLAGGLR